MAKAEQDKSSKTLDIKLNRILTGNYQSTDFIIADAKDADMAFGVRAAGPRAGKSFEHNGPDIFKTRSEYLQDMRELIEQGVLDIILTSASNGEKLFKDKALGKKITLAVRGNDASDIWNPRGGNYPASPSRPFATANLKIISKFCDLVLYSMTFNNDLDHDIRTLQAYKEFRMQAAEHGVRHFLEVFNPNTPQNLQPKQTGSFVNDHIVRSLAGVTSEERPKFLKIAYNGSESLRELSEHDPSLVVGILGGSAGTTRDTFELLYRAERSGGRVALFGRKIQRAESPLDLVALMRPVLEGNLTPQDAVNAYHATLKRSGITAFRSLDDDKQVTEPALLAE